MSLTVDAQGVASVDNRLALGQVVDRLERAGVSWALFHDPSTVHPEFRYEFRVQVGPAHGIYRGRTATHAATGAQIRLDESGGAM